MRHLLKTRFQQSGENSESTPKRLLNIRFIQSLNRGGLKFREKERQVLIKTTDSYEDIFIQYPGKESARKEEKYRPWDFRPKVFIKSEGKYAEDLGFRDIWGLFIDELRLADVDVKESVRALAIMFYRMAYLVDHEFCENLDTDIIDLAYEDGREIIANRHKHQFVDTPLFIYSPPKEPLDKVARHVPRFGNMSLEAFLCYNDLLAWNEDCKYYYREQLRKSGKWIKNIGRINNLLTHFSVLGWVLGDIRFQDILGNLQRGVARPTKKDMGLVARGYLEQ